MTLRAGGLRPNRRRVSSYHDNVNLARAVDAAQPKTPAISAAVSPSLAQSAAASRSRGLK